MGGQLDTLEFKINHSPAHLKDVTDDLSRRGDYKNGVSTYQAYKTLAFL